MTSSDNQLFSVEEALLRVAELHEQGCLVATKGSDAIQIYVQDGYVVRAIDGIREGEQAVIRALHLVDSSYEWTRGSQPPNPEKNIHLNIKELIIKNGNIHKKKIADTGKVAGGTSKKGSEPQYRYFLIPSNEPTARRALTKAATVIGRDSSSDMIIEHKDVSRRHCLLDIQPRGLYILDLDSTNGTFVNGILMTDGYLTHGDVIELGPYSLIVNRELITPGT
jgi:hypothetical protein